MVQCRYEDQYSSRKGGLTDTALRVYGHDWAQRLLRAAVVSGRTAHAYLLTGPDQVGKGTLARAFAQALCCEAPQAENGLGGCGRCRSCYLMHGGLHPDVRVVEPVGGQLRIDQMRDLIREAALSPVNGRFKVFIVPSFEVANANAANALLKTLEEPTDSTRILLTSNDSSGLLSTITSRCQIVALRPLSVSLVEDALEHGWQAPPDQARLLAGLSGGRLGWAVEVATQSGAWESQCRFWDQSQALTMMGVVERLSAADLLAKSEEAEAALRAWLLWWRDVMLLQRGCDDLVLNRERVEQLRSAAIALRPADVRRYLQALMHTAALLRQNVSSALALENLLLKVPSPA